jgi:solute:Na+ symporter, SSS family
MAKILSYGIVLFIYLALMLLIGWWTRKKAVSAEGYNLGNRAIGPWVTALSFVAAYFSSVVIIGGGAFGYKYGMSTIWIGTSNVLIGSFLAWLVLGKRLRLMSRDMNVVTLSELFEKRFGSKSSALYSAIIIGVFLIIYNVSVLKGMANTFEGMMQMPYWLGVLISGIIMIFYVSLGGYFAVVWTSFAQAWFMLFGLILLLIFTVSHLGGFAQIHSQLNAINPGFTATPGNWGWGGLISYCMIVSFGVWGMPQLMIRFYSIKDTKVLKTGTVLATIGASMAIIPYFVGAASRLILPDISTPDLAIPTLVNNIMPSWAGALFLAGVIAAGMSTFAGVLIIISTSLVRDVWMKGFKKQLTDEQEVRAGRLVSFTVGLISMIIALKPPALILVLTAFSWAVIASVTLWPLVFALFWKKLNGNAIIWGMVCGSASAIIWVILKNPLKIHGFIVGTIIALLTIVIANFILPKRKTM